MGVTTGSRVDVRAGLHRAANERPHVLKFALRRCGLRRVAVEEVKNASLEESSSAPCNGVE
jgi:hypothetical protein